MCETCGSLRLTLERWQDVAYVDAADVTERARREGIVVETGREPAFRTFLREFDRKAADYGT